MGGWASFQPIASTSTPQSYHSSSAASTRELVRVGSLDHRECIYAALERTSAPVSRPALDILRQKNAGVPFRSSRLGERRQVGELLGVGLVHAGREAALGELV